MTAETNYDGRNGAPSPQLQLGAISGGAGCYRRALRICDAIPSRRPVGKETRGIDGVHRIATDIRVQVRIPAAEANRVWFDPGAGLRVVVSGAEVEEAAVAVEDAASEGETVVTDVIELFGIVGS